jgi:putative intracellular protease/amidase
MCKLLTAIVVSTLLPAAGALADENPRVFMFVTEGSRDPDLMIGEEVGVMRSMLEDAGYTVDIATTGDAPLAGDRLALTPTIALADVDIERYAGVVLPCMAPAPGTTIPAVVEDLVRAALAAGKPVAASRGSVATLARAGGLAGHDFAYASPVDPDKRPEFTGGRYLGTGTVRDGLISTTGICPLAARELDMPDGTAALMESFIATLAGTG